MQIFDTVLSWIGQFLGWLDKITGNYMLALLLFALVVEIIMLPFGIKQQKNAIKQARLRPKERAIKNKYKGRNDKVTQQKMADEIQRMYQEENFNQLSGCLPMLLQLPVILALYQVVINPLRYVVGISKDAITAMLAYASKLAEDNVLEKAVNTRRGTIELISLINEKGIEFFKGIIEYVDSGAEAVKDLGISGAEVYEEFAGNVANFPNFKALGIDLGATIDIKQLSLLWLVPVITFVVYFFSMKLNKKLMGQTPATGDAPTDKATGCTNTMMDVMMPAFSAYIAFIVPAAIGVYWVFKSILSTLKQFILSKIMPLPVFTEEDYKAAEREYAGKTPKDKKTRVDIDATMASSKSLFRKDQEDYVSPDVEADIESRLNASDPGAGDGGMITRAPVKDESDKEKK
jgi:YidC/Oxa1 family membrane protein insertase